MIKKITEAFLQEPLSSYLVSISAGITTYFILRGGEYFAYFCRTRKRISFLNVDCRVQHLPQDKFPTKLIIEFRNWTNATLLLRIEGFALDKGVKCHPSGKRDSTSGLVEVKFIEQHSSQAGTQILNIDSILRHGEQKSVWIPLDPSVDVSVYEKALEGEKMGKLVASVLWFDIKPKFIRFRPKIRRS